MTYRYSASLIQCFVIVVALISVSTADQAEAEKSPAERINAANELLRQGATAEALRGYQAIADAEQVRDELNYNQAIALYRGGELDAAAELFAQSAPSADRKIAAASKYNLGNCNYQRAIQLSEQQPKLAVAELRQAIGHYRGALRIAPDNTDARVNIELAMKLIDQLEKEQEPTEQPDPADQQPEDKEQEDKENNDKEQEDKEQEDKEKDDKQQGDKEQGDTEQQQSEDPQSESEQENDSAEPSEDPNNTQDPSEGQSSQDQSSQEQSSDSEQDAADQQQATEDQEPNANQNSPGTPPNKNTDQAESQEQKAAERDPGEEKATDAAKPTPSGELTAADPSANSADGEAASEGKPLGRRAMSREEALKLLQAVRDRDMLRRMQRQQLERSRRVPVERDW
jgi:Ca-activated chloride channel family protein